MFGDRIKEAVKVLGSVKELSEASGIGVRTLRTYLTNSSQPSAENLAKIALATKVDSHWLLTGERLSTREEVSTDKNATQEIDIGFFMHIYDIAPEYAPSVVGEHPIFSVVRAYNKAVSEPKNIRNLKAQLELISDGLKFTEWRLNSEMSYEPIDESEASLYSMQIAQGKSMRKELKETEKEILKNIKAIQAG